MSALQVGSLAGALVAAALWCVSVGVRRAPRSLAEARARSAGSSPSGSPRGDGPGTHFVQRRLGHGLALLDQSPAAVASRIATAAGTVFLAVLAAVAALLAAGLLPLSPVWPAAALVAGVLAGWTMWRDAHSRVERRRRELQQAATDFVQLVAVGLTTDQSVEEAVRFALDVGDGPAFDLIREPVLAAPQRGVPVWEAIDDVGRTADVRELSEFAASVERQGLQGVAIGDTVATLAEAMRAKALDRLEREADRANANLAGPTIGFVVTTIVFLAYPLAVRIGEAFGG